nr:radical SAM protein [uncultured Campylobacter sp.]
MKKTIVIKPTLECNLRCKYCYEFRRDNLTEVANQRVDIGETKKVILKFANIFPKSQILWMLHGGEPLLCGAKSLSELLDFIRDINLNYDVNFKFALQTNGTLLDDKILEILEKNSDILSERVISISIDGPKDIHDKIRLTKSNQASFDRVLSSINRIKSSSLSFTTISVIGRHNVDKPRQMYEFFRELNPNYAKFIPCYNLDKFGNTEDTGITPMQYAKFMAIMFNLYSKDIENFKNNKLAIDPLITIISNLVDKRVTWCEYSTSKCDNFSTIFPNGDLWLCDTFKQDSMKNEAYLGNIFELSNEKIRDLFEKPLNHCSYSNLETEVLSQCKKCDIWKYCYGGCIAVRQEFKLKSKAIFDEHCEAKRFLINHIKKPVFNALS